MTAATVLEREQFLKKIQEIITLAQQEGQRFELSIQNRNSIEVLYEALDNEQWKLLRDNLLINTSQEGADFLQWADKKKGYAGD